MTLLDDMLALLPDNFAGDISAGDMRTIVTDLYNLATTGAFQPLDSDLTTIAGLTATTDNFMQAKSSAWASRTPAQVATDLQSLVTIAESQVTNLVSDLAAKVDKSTLTTKGDVYVATASGTVTRIGVGTDGQVLTADAAQTPGVKWATPATGGVSSARQILTGTGLTGGGDLTADRTISMANMAANSIKGNNTGAPAAPVDLTAAQTKTLLAITESDVANLVSDLAGKQPLDSDLTTIAGLTATTDVFLQSKASAWTTRTPAQVAADVQGSVTIAESQVTNLVTDLSNKQPLDSDLTTIAGLTATTDNFMQSKSSAWASRTPAQVATDLQAAGLAPIASPTFTGTVTLPGDPASALQAATKQYVDALGVTVGRRHTVRAATTANITISTALNNADTLDGITLATGDLVLVKDQSTAAQNGIYVVGVSPARSSEFDTYNEHPGTTITVQEGTANADTTWVCTSNAGGTLDTTAIAFANIQTLLTIAESQVTNLVTDLSNKQPLDSDLTTIAGLTATTDSFIQSKASAWSARTVAQVLTDLAAPGTTFQPLDSDLTTIAGLTATTDSFMQSKGSAWSARTVAQVLTDLAVPGTTFQPLDSDLTTIAGLTATTDNFLQSKSSAWASRTPAQVSTDLQAAGLAPKAAPALTGAATAVDLTLSGKLVVTPDALTDAATIATDFANGNHGRVTLGGNRTLGNPTNAVDGQKYMWELIQDGTGTRTITLDTKFALGTDITAVTLTTTINKRDFLGVVYNSTADKFYVIAFVKGY